MAVTSPDILVETELDPIGMDLREDGFRQKFPFKSLFQNSRPRAMSHEKDSVPIQLMAKPLLPYDFGQIVGAARCPGKRGVSRSGSRILPENSIRCKRPSSALIGEALSELVRAPSAGLDPEGERMPVDYQADDALRRIYAALAEALGLCRGLTTRSEPAILRFSDEAGPLIPI